MISSVEFLHLPIEILQLSVSMFLTHDAADNTLSATTISPNKVFSA